MDGLAIQGVRWRVKCHFPGKARPCQGPSRCGRVAATQSLRSGLGFYNMINIIYKEQLMTAVDSIGAADTTDLFSAALRRERGVDWQGPLPVARGAGGVA